MVDCSLATATCAGAHGRRNHLAVAIDNLNQAFAAVLLTEQMERSSAYLTKIFWMRLPTVVEMKTLLQNEKLSIPRSGGRLAERNALDVKLYEYARRRFETDASSVGNQAASG